MGLIQSWKKHILSATTQKNINICNIQYIYMYNLYVGGSRTSITKNLSEGSRKSVFLMSRVLKNRAGTQLTLRLVEVNPSPQY